MNKLQEDIITSTSVPEELTELVEILLEYAEHFKNPKTLVKILNVLNDDDDKNNTALHPDDTSKNKKKK